MGRFALFVSSLSALFLWPTSVVVAKEENDDKPLFFREIDDFVVPCSDGSNAGIYTDFEALNDGPETRNSHIIHFMGGGGCSSEISCRLLSKQKPYFFSSLYEFESITGHTIVSNDPLENPGLAGDFAKWVVPYCTQDLWLGSGKEWSGFIRSGSLSVEATLKHWLGVVTASNSTVDTLVLSGHSAGNFAILNHMDQIRAVANEAGVKRLRFVLDASMLTDKIDADFETLFRATVDPEVHPLCWDDPEKTPYDELRVTATKELSQLPCCLSTHCMLRHSPSLSDIKSQNPSKDERLLLIDTAYDFLQTFSYLTADSGNRNAVGGNSNDTANGIISLTGLSSSVFNIGESGGIRKSRILETLFAGGRYVGPGVVWAMPSAILHNTIFPSAEIGTRVCARQEMEDTENECGSSDCVFLENPFGIKDECNATGFGLSVEVFGGLKITSWTNTEAWKRATINGVSIRDIITDFVLTPSPASGSNTTEQPHATLLFEACPGPNCVAEGSKDSNQVQSLLEIEDTFVPVPTWLMALVTLVLLTIVATYLFMAHYQRDDKDNAQQKPNWNGTAQKSRRLLRVQTARFGKSDIYLRGLCVESNEGSKILEGVDLSLKNSTLNCLLGKSGSGKSTLLSVLGYQLKPNLSATLIATSDISSIPSTFMRQLDLVTMENITPIDFLRTTSKIYGADSECLEFVLGLIEPFFPVKTMKDENNVETVLLDPFHEAAIRDLSGGQRRLLSIASALFQNTSLLLLDEPLSGLDSVSSMKVIELLSFIAKENAVTILMTLHQPSNEILGLMDGIMVLARGKVAFDSRIDSIKDDKHTSAEFVHELLSETKDVKPKIACITEEEEDDLLSAPLILTKSERVLSSKHFNKTATIAPSSRKLQRMKSVKEKTMLESFIKELRLWQVQPLVRRISLEHSLKPQDFLVLPTCFLIVSAWGSIDANNPLLAFVLTISNISAAAVINQVRIIQNWEVLTAHLWDLEDKRISPLSFMIASTFQILYVPIITVPFSLMISYAVLGWNWEPFWAASLFVTLVVVCTLQLAKTMEAKLKTFQATSALFNVVAYVGYCDMTMFRKLLRIRTRTLSHKLCSNFFHWIPGL